jgi:hypothetical protein
MEKALSKIYPLWNIPKVIAVSGESEKNRYF